MSTDRPFQAARINKSWQQHVSGSPEQVFPLLCPVREYEWIPDWKSETVYLKSGHAEDGGVFVTNFPGRGPGTWVISRYEPPTAIGFVIFYPDRLVERLDVTLAAGRAGGSQGGTHIRWDRTYTGLSEEGNRFLAELTGAPLEARMQRQLRLLEHFCATGQMLSI